ncbi:MAG: Alanine--tRNA ligase [Turneriella sp.]|nr:Alanine--tRNA ligase [Turneriella sp.]
MKINTIRNSFLSFFESKNHLRVPSASLLPSFDPTLLFTTAGMVPFKDYFSGAKNPPSPRLVSVQKCLRTTDLESVGKTKRHLSFFEMLGNFSFGDYFKKEAIEFAWEYSTQFLPFPKEKIWISVFENDDEAVEIWHKHIGVPKERIVRLGRADNFWGPAGDAGACGPCSELYLDRGEEFGTDKENQAPGGSGDRFMEFWNLVFNQFDFQNGEYLPLKKTGIDTGAGLERLATLTQGVDSVFDTDELKLLRQSAAQIFKANYTDSAVTPLRVITDHIRTLTFAMSDGIFPSNESRGYVLRRVLRRAMLFGRKLGQKEPLLYKLCDTVKDIYGEFYVELSENIPFISDYIREEEGRFLRTLESGAHRLEEMVIAAKETQKKTLLGKDVFQLYDTFGFPLEMTVELAEQEGLTVDVDGFKIQMEKQRERGRAAWKGVVTLPIAQEISTEFIGYETLEGTGTIVSLVQDNQSVGTLSEKDLNTLSFLVADKTPFYAEGGGQLGDNGFVKTQTASARITDCRKQGDAYVHLVTQIEGTFRVGDKVEFFVDKERRDALKKHHSVTHLLNAALRNKLGNHVKQTGSLVHPDYLRFDFSHPKALSVDEVVALEQAVNGAIAANIKVETAVLKKSEAEKRGAVMAFGEKYGDVVRVVEMGTFSKEFCGGTHVAQTGDIDTFFILKEASPGAGNRRIEAVASSAARKVLSQRVKQLITLSQEITDATLLQKVHALEKKMQAEVNQPLWREVLSVEMALNHALEAVRKERKKMGASLSGAEALLEDLFSGTKKTSSGIAFYVKEFTGKTLDELKALVDKAREKNSQAVYLVYSQSETVTVFVCGTSAQCAAQNKIHLGQLLKGMPKDLGVTGGGKAEFVQGKFSCSVNDFEEKLTAEL